MGDGWFQRRATAAGAEVAGSAGTRTTGPGASRCVIPPPATATCW